MKQYFQVCWLMIFILIIITSCSALRSERFVSYSNGVVKDYETGLMWSMTDNGRDVKWESASAYCITYTKGQFANWRMPTVGEVETLFKSFDNKKSEAMKHINITGKHVWTSTIDPNKSKAGYYVVPGKYWQYGAIYGSFRARALPVRRFKKLK